MISPTATQQRLLRYIAGYQAVNHGISPSCEEMAAALGWKAKSNAVRLINGLEERGMIRRVPHRARAIEILHPEDLVLPIIGDTPLFFAPVHTNGITPCHPR